MKIKVLGKIHREGTARRTGNPYNFNRIYYIGKEQDVEGQTACVLALDSQFVPYESIKVGTEYTVEFNQRGYVVEFSPVG